MIPARGFSSAEFFHCIETVLSYRLKKMILKRTGGRAQNSKVKTQKPCKLALLVHLEPQNEQIARSLFKNALFVLLVSKRAGGREAANFQKLP